MLSWEQYSELAEQAVSQGKFADAEALWLAALQHVESDERDPRLTASMRKLAEALCYQRKYVGAESLYLRCLETSERVHGPSHAEVVKSLVGLASIYYNQGKYAEAEPVCERLLLLLQTMAGYDDEQAGPVISSLATLYHAQKKYDKAEGYYKRALAARTKTLGAGHPEVISLMDKYANLLSMTHRDEQAQYFRTCVKKYYSGEWAVPGTEKEQG